MTRDEILKKLQGEHTSLVAALAGIPDDVMMTQPVIGCGASSRGKEELSSEEGSPRDDAPWTCKDVMGHIAMWHQVAIKFIDEYLRDGVPASLGLKDDAAIDAYNKRGAALRRDWPLARVRAEFDAAFRDLIAAVKKLSDAQLNAPLPAPWNSDVTLERLIAWNSYEHEPEHTEQIVKWRKGNAAHGTFGL